MGKQVKIFYDTEFLEDGHTIDLISIGMVNYETGDILYAVSNEFDTRRVAKNDWLMENVMSSIPHDQFVVTDFQGARVVKDIHPTGPDVMSRDEIRIRIEDFVSGWWPDFWAWYGAYDHVALCQLWGKMIDLPKGMPMMTSDLKQLHKMAGSPNMPEQPPGKHNALEDALFNVTRYQYLTALLGM
jgi:hypothetical protein